MPARFACLFVFLAACLSNLVQAEEFSWPHWRGPNYDDVSLEKGLLKKWPDSGPTRVWLNEDVGLGYSDIAIVGGKLFTMGLRDDDKEYVICCDANTGKQLWETAIGDKLKNDWGNGPRGTPTVAGNFVYALSGQGDIACLAVADGSLKWHKTAKEFGGGTPGWGYCESVLIDGDLAVFTPGGSKGSLVALDKDSGEKIWQSEDVKIGAQYASIVPVNMHNKRQYIQLFQKEFVGVDASNGMKLWETGFGGSTAVIPTPIVHGDQVYVSAGYGAGSKSVKISSDNMVEDLYENKVMKNHHGGVLFLDGYVYGHSDGPGWVCQNFKTGEEVWAEKKLGKGSVTCADGMLYCLEERDGNIALVKASPEKFEEISRFKLEPQTTKRKKDGRIWTHPVVCNGKLYVRDQELLSCYNVKE